MNKPIPVVVAGALGRMGAELVKTLQACADCELVAAIDTTPGQEGEDVGLALGLKALEVAVTADLEGSLCMASQQHPGSVLVDFTHPKVVYKHARAAIAYGVAPVIGTTGLSPEQIQDLADFAVKATMGAAEIPIPGVRLLPAFLVFALAHLAELIFFALEFGFLPGFATLAIAVALFGLFPPSLCDSNGFQSLANRG